MGLIFRSTSAIETGVWICIATGFRSPLERTRVVISRNQQWCKGRVYMPSKQQDLCCLRCPTTYPRASQAPRAVGIWLSPLCRLQEPCYSLLAVAMLRNDNFCLVERRWKSPSGRYMLMNESNTDRQRGGTCRVSLVASTRYHASAWDEMVRCDEPHVV